VLAMEDLVVSVASAMVELVVPVLVELVVSESWGNHYRWCTFWCDRYCTVHPAPSSLRTLNYPPTYCSSTLTRSAVAKGMAYERLILDTQSLNRISCLRQCCTDRLALSTTHKWCRRPNCSSSKLVLLAEGVELAEQAWEEEQELVDLVAMGVLPSQSLDN